jgi:hypothetical protein
MDEIQAVEPEAINYLLREGRRYSMAKFPPVRFIVRPTFRPRTAFVRDFSERGMSLLVEQALEPGMILAIQLQSRHLGVSGILSAQVRHVIRRNGDAWLVGCELSRQLTRDEVETLLRSEREC